MEREGKIRIISNKKLLLVIIVLLVFFIFVIYISVILKYKNIRENYECSTDAECVPSSCCHPTSCVPYGKQENCSGVFCTAVCSGPLDCSLGYCGCVNNKCSIIKNK